MARSRPKRAKLQGRCAFREGTPTELKRIRLPARIALAEALELITREVATAIAAVAKVRNRLAHGGDDVVTADEIRSLRDGVAPFLGDELDLDNWDEVDQLRIALAGIWQATDYTVEYALEKRAEADAALAAWRQQQALSKEEVAELLSRAAADP